MTQAIEFSVTSSDQVEMVGPDGHAYYLEPDAAERLAERLLLCAAGTRDMQVRIRYRPTTEQVLSVSGDWREVDLLSGDWHTSVRSALAESSCVRFVVRRSGIDIETPFTKQVSRYIRQLVKKNGCQVHLSNGGRCLFVRVTKPQQ